jgi:hypothetical protein
MANLTPKLLYLGAATGANVITVSNNAGSYSIIKNINLCNITSSAATCNVHLLVSGVSAAANNNAILKSFTVAPNETVAYNGIVVLPANSNLYVSQANANITLSISGVEYAT